MAVGRPGRRATFAIGQAEETVDAARALVGYLREAVSAGTPAADVVREVARRVAHVERSAHEAQVAAEWVDAGELKAVANLTGRDSASAELREIDVRQRAAEIGLVLRTA